METDKFIEWLKAENLFSLVESNYKNFGRIYDKCLKVKNEKVLIIGDFGYPTRRIAPILIGCYVMSAKEKGIDFNLAMQDPKAIGEPAEEEVIAELSSLPKNSVMIQAQSGRIGSLKEIGKSYRKFSRDNNHRFVSTMSLGDIDTFLLKRVIQPIMIDYDQMREYQMKLKKILDKAKKIRIKTKSGTDLTIEFDGIVSISNDGIYSEPGTGGNIPAGEVYFTPKNSNGKLIVDASSRNTSCTTLIEKPIILNIKENRIESISGGEEADLLEKSLTSAEERAKYPERVRVVAELGIGTNPKARVVGSTIIDEKALGTAHLAIGSNYWFGGQNRTIIHLDQVFNQPKLIIDDKRINLSNI